MAQQDILLPGVEHDEQTEEYWCGPACINIVLSLWDKQQAQPDLWGRIQTNTGPQMLPNTAPAHTTLCHPCATAGTHECWYTTPEVMAQTINEFSPEPVSAAFLGSHDALRRLADSLSAPAPVCGVFTTTASLHWVVAVGYQTDAPLTASIPWNGVNLTGFYVRDPATADPGTDIAHLITVPGFLKGVTGLLAMARCGPNPNLYPVVARSPLAGVNFTARSTTTPKRSFIEWVLMEFKFWWSKMKNTNQPRPPGPEPPYSR